MCSVFEVRSKWSWKLSCLAEVELCQDETQEEDLAGRKSQDEGLFSHSGPGNCLCEDVQKPMRLHRGHWNKHRERSLLTSLGCYSIARVGLEALYTV